MIKYPEESDKNLNFVPFELNAYQVFAVLLALC